MRIQNSINNISILIITQIVTVLLGFISRKVFIDNLGMDYLGVNGLLTNILSMLTLVEGGVGTSIIYNLYKPLADDDKPKVISLVQLYKKLYMIFAVVVILISIIVYPFAKNMIGNDSNIEYISIIYLIFIVKNVISYLNAHKWSLINADQKQHILARINLIINVVTMFVKIIILNYTQNYILYLLVELLLFLFQNIYNGRIVNKRYPYIKTNSKYEASEEVKNNIITNVKAIFFHKIGTFCIFGTDNLLISYFINIHTVGLYSNYTMIINQLANLVNPLLSGIEASVGNLIAVEKEDKIYSIFKVMYFINFWIYSFCTIFLYNLIDPFITWWIGKEFLMNKLTLIIILLNFYLNGLRVCITTFKTKGGIFTQDKYMPLLESIINLSVSLILVKYFGLAGIFMGTTVSTLAIPFWNQPRLIYKNIFNKPVIEYFIIYFRYILITIVAGYVTNIICDTILIEGFFGLIVKGIICVIIPNFILITALYRDKEFKYISSLLKEIMLNKISLIKKLNMYKIETQK